MKQRLIDYHNNKAAMLAKIGKESSDSNVIAEAKALVEFHTEAALWLENLLPLTPLS